MKAENLTYESANVLGVSYSLPEMRDVPVTRGRFFSETEERMHSPVAVVGDDIRATLFPNVSPLGHTIRVGGQEFTVIGLLERSR